MGRCFCMGGTGKLVAELEKADAPAEYRDQA